MLLEQHSDMGEKPNHVRLVDLTGMQVSQPVYDLTSFEFFEDSGPVVDRVSKSILI